MLNIYKKKILTCFKLEYQKVMKSKLNNYIKYYIITHK